MELIYDVLFCFLEQWLRASLLISFPFSLVCSRGLLAKKKKTFIISHISVASLSLSDLVFEVTLFKEGEGVEAEGIAGCFVNLWNVNSLVQRQ